MLCVGEKVKFSNRDVVVLNCNEDEVLIFIDERTIKWVDKANIEIAKSA